MIGIFCHAIYVILKLYYFSISSTVRKAPLITIAPDEARNPRLCGSALYHRSRHDAIDIGPKVCVSNIIGRSI